MDLVTKLKRKNQVKGKACLWFRFLRVFCLKFSPNLEFSWPFSFQVFGLFFFLSERRALLRMTLQATSQAQNVNKLK